MTPLVDLDTARRNHPLATRSGIAMLTEIVHADTVWRRATRRQQQLLDTLCAPIIANLKAGDTVRLDDLPIVRAHPRTLRSLQAQGLVNDTDQLTVKAVHAAYWTSRTTPGDPE